MQHMILPTHEPKQLGPIHPPMVYIKESVKWEYKQMVRNLEKENPPDEAELNALGAAGWEMAGVAHQPPLAYFYFKRLTEK